MLFDIRTIIGALLGCYGVVLVITSLVQDSAEQAAKTGGLDVNLWAGLGMLGVAVVFIGWAALRPVQVPARPDLPLDEFTPDA
ncbi:hypothetical protein NN3_60580 [Nocardia neocaledoniensis NBRC 108232]|uniref:Uncharacterized protein n=1 Tax=Nocardia neocaledoniensis TaxID=236511 RepID=A0A317NUX1_9NOCA|nr:hypothetical protein [Nocardia neocaledoniensis]PWV79176.1 hypothetical protein DFR69_102238 [Nocardia neocaledoniensis]GEM35051.1 hypothetical protein NN3_60580 [Nocardia neocaledoniensis NBRC 108232]